VQKKDIKKYRKHQVIADKSNNKMQMFGFVFLFSFEYDDYLLYN